MIFRNFHHFGAWIGVILIVLTPSFAAKAGWGERLCFWRFGQMGNENVPTLVSVEPTPIDLTNFKVNARNAAVIDGDPALRAKVDRLNRLNTIYIAMNNGDPPFDTHAIMNALDLPTDVPDEWLRRFPDLPAPPERVYARWTQLQHLDLDEDELIVLASAFASEPLRRLEPAADLATVMMRIRNVVKDPYYEDVVKALDMERIIAESDRLREWMKDVPGAKGKYPKNLEVALGTLANFGRSFISDGVLLSGSKSRIKTILKLNLRRAIRNAEDRERIADFLADRYLLAPVPTDDNIRIARNLRQRIVADLASVREESGRILENQDRIAAAARQAEVEAERLAARNAQAQVAEEAPKDQGRKPNKKKRRRKAAMAPPSDQNPRSIVPQATGPRDRLNAEDQRRAPREEGNSGGVANDGDGDQADATATVGRPARIRKPTHPEEPLSKRAIIVDANIVISAQQIGSGNIGPLSHGIKNSFEELSGGYSLRTGGRTFLPGKVIEESRGDMAFAGAYKRLQLTVTRDDPDYKNLLDVLEKMEVGVPLKEAPIADDGYEVIINGRRVRVQDVPDPTDGAADREIIADIAFAARTSDKVVPKFFTADSNIYKRLCVLTPICDASTPTHEFFRRFPDGFEIELPIGRGVKRKVRIVPVPVFSDAI